MKRPIAISLSPNAEKDDVRKALSLMFKPYGWKNDGTVKKLEQKFSDLFGSEYRSFAIRSGRESLYLILQTLGITNGDEVILQSFTCSAAVNPILWVGAKPVYVDIDDSFNLDINDLEKKLTKKTKAVIVQHTFGIPAQMEKIRKIVDIHNLILIEDCAVSLGATVKNKKIGTFGDISFFSFGRDKIISSVWGGMILTKNKKYIKKLEKQMAQFNMPLNFWIFQQLMHPVSFSIILPLYNFGYKKITLGKLLLFCLQKLKLLSKPITDEEKKAKKHPGMVKKMPGAIADLALNQLSKLDVFNTKRKSIAYQYYKIFQNNKDIQLPEWNEGSVWLRYPILVSDANRLLNFAKNRGVLLGDWYKDPIYPIDDFKYVRYQFGVTPKVEMLKNKVVNLPTYPLLNKTDIDKVVLLIKEWIKSQ